MLCEMCGSDDKLFRVIIEETELKVCRKCSSFGNILGPVKKPVPKEKKAAGKEEEVKEEEPQMIQAVVSDYAKKIRKKREMLGMTQEEFAKKLAEKESIVHKLETGIYKPSIKFAQKLEKMLKIKLIEEIDDKIIHVGSGDNSQFTIGDMIKKSG